MFPVKYCRRSDANWGRVVQAQMDHVSKTLEHVFDTTIRGTIITSPMLDVKSIAAGGGSILKWKMACLWLAVRWLVSAPFGWVRHITNQPQSAGAQSCACILPQGRPFYHYWCRTCFSLDLSQKEFLLFSAQLQTNHWMLILCSKGFRNSWPRSTRILTSRWYQKRSRPGSSVWPMKQWAGRSDSYHKLEDLQSWNRRILIHNYSSILSAYGIELASIVSYQ